jgi:hypothetical protein
MAALHHYPGLPEALQQALEPLLATQYSSWYSKYAKCAFNSIVIPIPPEFVAYLQADGVYLADGSAAVSMVQHLPVEGAL